MSFTSDDLREASALVRFALDPREVPMHVPDYQQACEQYHARSAVRDACAVVAGTLGMAVLAVDARFGAVLVATGPDSPFRFDAGDLIPSSRNRASDRQRDGVYLLAIMATAFPRRSALVGDASLALPPFSVEDVLHTLRDARVSAEAADTANAAAGPLAPVADEDRPLWALIKNVPEVRETPDGRLVNNTVHGRITTLLEKLQLLGSLDSERGGESWRPTWRWQTQVRAFAHGPTWASVAPVFWPDDVVRLD